MKIVIENLPRDVSEEAIRQDLTPFAPVEKIELIRQGSGEPVAVIRMDMTRTQAQALAMRINGLIHKGQRLRAWVPLWNP